MNDKSNEPGGIRAHLLESEPPNVERMQRLHQEIQAVFTQSLTPAKRTSWIVVFVISVVLTNVGIARLWHMPQTDLPMQAIWWLFTFTMLLNALFAARVLWRGTVDLRRMAAFQKISVPATLSVAILLIIQALEHPTLVALGWALFGMIWLVVAMAILLYNRIVAAELATRETLLRLELRMVEFAENRR